METCVNCLIGIKPLTKKLKTISWISHRHKYILNRAVACNVADTVSNMWQFYRKDAGKLAFVIALLS